MEFLIILLLILLNGVFALSEIAIVSVRKQRIAQLAEAGNRRAITVLELLKNPENFLSAVQIGITLVGIVSGAYGGVTLTDDFRPVIEKAEMLRPYAQEIAYFGVVALITYLSIVIGELIPKTIGIKYGEPLALAIAGPIRMFSRLARPVVWLLTKSTTLVLSVFGIKQDAEEKITEDDLRYFIKTAGKQGLFDKDESEIHDKVLEFGDLRVKSLMTHRLKVEWVDITDPIESIEKQLFPSHHSHFPVCEESYDHVLGFLHIKDFLSRKHEPGFQLHSILREPVFVPENNHAIDVLRQFKKRRCYYGIVVDEYGAFEGVVTLHDLLEALVGDLPDQESEASGFTRREDGSLLVSGDVLVSELNYYLQADIIPENDPFYSTLAGFILHRLEHLPEVGEKFDYLDLQIEILDMDGTKIDKVLVNKIAAKSKGSQVP